MGNSNGLMVLPTSRSVISDVEDDTNLHFLKQKETKKFPNNKDLKDVDVTVGAYIPRGFSGYPVYKFSILQTTDPYSVVNFEHPDHDPWYRDTIPKQVDKHQPTLKEFGYIYVYNEIGYSVLDKDTKKPVLPNHFHDGFASDDTDFSFPKLVVRNEDSKFIYEYSTTVNHTTSVIVNVESSPSDFRMFKFYNKRINQIMNDDEDKIHLIAQYHAYVYLLFNSKENLGYNPFYEAQYATKFSYPYAIVADLIIYDNFYNYNEDYSTIVKCALEFTRLYLRDIWYIDKTKPFHYGYLDIFHQQASLRIAAKIGSHYNFDMKNAAITSKSDNF